MSAMPVMLIQNEIIAQERSLDVISTVGQWRMQMNAGVLVGTVNGGPWLPFVMGAVVVTMQSAYDGGGAVGTGLGRTVATMTGGPIVLTQNNPANDALQISMGALSTTQGITIVSTGANATSRGINVTMNGAAATGPGIAVNMGVSCSGQAILVTAANGASQEIVQINSTATVLAGGGHRELLIARQQTFVASQTQSRSAFSILSQNILNDAGAGTQTLTLNGLLAEIVHAPTLTSGLAITDTTTGLAITMTPAAASAVKGQTITMGAFTSAAGYAATFSSAGTAGEAVGNAIVNVEKTGVLTAQTVGLEIDLTGTTPGAFAHIGQRILIPATTRADTVLEAGLVISSLATEERGIDCKMASTTYTNGGAYGAVLRRDGSVATNQTLTKSLLWLNNIPGCSANTLTMNGTILNIIHAPTGVGSFTDTTTGLAITMTPAAASAVTGATITMGPNTSSSGRGLTISTSGAAAGQMQRIDVYSAAAANTYCLVIAADANAAATADGTGLFIDRSPTALGGNDTGHLARIGYGAVAATARTWSGSIFHVINAPHSTGGGTVFTTSGSLVYLLHSPVTGTGTYTDTTTGLTITMTPAAASAVNGVNVAMGALTSNAGYAATFSSSGTAGEAVGNGIVNITKTGILTGQTVGLEIDLTGTTPGAFAHIGQRILIPATTRADTALLEAALVISSTATRCRMIDCAVANTGAATGLWVLRYGTATTCTATVSGITVDLSTNINAATAVALTCYTAKLGVNMGTNASVGFAFTRTGTWTTNGAAWNGSAINIQNTPTEGGGGITTTESGGLIVVNHQTTAGAGVITDTKIGIVVTMTPGVASANIGIQVTMGENATGPALDLVSPGAGTNVAFIQLIANSAAPTSDAAAGAANTGRVYVRLNGGGKSELVCRFDSGAVQVMATEP